MSRSEDIALLHRLLMAPDVEDRAGLSDRERSAFKNMVDQLEAGVREELSFNQRHWLHTAVERVLDEPFYENAWSAGKVPHGIVGATPTPDVLKTPLPKKPPGRQ